MEDEIMGAIEGFASQKKALWWKSFFGLGTKKRNRNLAPKLIFYSPLTPPLTPSSLHPFARLSLSG
jgi:hypothetical protein